MKKIIKSSLLLLGALVMFTACSDDRDSNPTLVQPDSFVLNAPAYATSDIDLASSTAIPFTWSQPNYGGFPVATEYQFQISTTGNFTTSVEQAIADESGETVADYATIEDVFTECKGGVTATHIAKALQQLEQWPEDEVPATQEVYLRAVAKAIGAQPVYSNVIKLDKVIPYYVELKDAPIVLWYLVGNCIGEGDWSNSADKIGVSLIPLLPDPNAEFNKVDGTGIIVYAGYFPAGGQFKLIKNPGSWDEQMNFTNVKGSDGIVSDEDGDNHNIGILNEGYYKIIVNTEKNEIEVTAIEAAPEYGTITMPGTYQGWDPTANAMTPMAGARVNEWMATVTFDADAIVANDEGVKFANGSWDVNWGNDNHSFPLGLGVQGQGNIHYKKGTYTVYFNDILGIYYFIEQ